jgi:hypothetical protein
MITGSVQTPMGVVPQVATKLSHKDYLGTLMVRWSVNRSNYKVAPGIYAAGTPNESSDVFVTANYKLSFDTVRKNLDGLNAWILVLDTKGINVWCAAGKGTFGTKELVNRIKITGLEKIINHRRIILPQLGAVGVSAHQVRKLTEAAPGNFIQNPGKVSSGLAFSTEGIQITNTKGFKVIYGPVRASDIKDFVAGGYMASKEMRKVTFNFYDRIKLIPVDFVNGKYCLLAALALVLILSGVNPFGLSFQHALLYAPGMMLNIFLAYVSGIVITPMFLPYIPVRPFAFKGFITGFVVALILMLFQRLGAGYFEIVSWFMIISGLSSFVAMNFTGSSTYTSLSGVKKEMKAAIPLQIAFAAIGLVLLMLGKIV